MRNPALNKMLGEVLAKVPAPTGGRNYTASLIRNREIQRLLAEKATEAAEREWPGFTEMMAELIARELEFIDKAGPVA